MEEFGILEEDKRKLLDFLLLENPTQENLDHIIGCYFNDEVSQEDLLPLLKFWTKHRTMVFPANVLAAFKDVRASYLLSLTRLTSDFSTICSKLVSAGIDVALIKGVSMICMDPSSPRFMADMDVLVKEDHFAKSLKIAESLGYWYSLDVHSADLHTDDVQEGIMDIHKFVPMVSGKGKRISEDIFSRAERKNFAGVDCLLPCIEDLLFIAITNFSRNLMDNARQAKIFTELLDFKKLISQGVDWNIFKEDCVKTESEDEVSFTAQLVNTLLPGIFPEQVVDMASEKARRRFEALFKFRRQVLVPLQAKRSFLTLREVLKNPGRLPYFLTLRPLYLFLKLFKYSPRIVYIFYGKK